MDEPLASLDAPRKAEILPYLERLRDALRVPVVYVSHSLEEVTRLADDVVALAEGRVVASGPAAEVLALPELEAVTGRFEAGSLLTARVRGEVEAFALTLLDHPAGELRVPRLGLPAGTAVRIRVRARDVTLAASWGELPGLSTRNRLRARVVAVRPSEDALADVTLDAAGEALAARVTREAAADLGPRARAGGHGADQDGRHRAARGRAGRGGRRLGSAWAKGRPDGIALQIAALTCSSLPCPPHDIARTHDRPRRRDLLRTASVLPAWGMLAPVLLHAPACSPRTPPQGRWRAGRSTGSG
jgi:hypothetical protein